MGEAWDLVQQSGIGPWWVNEAFIEEMEQQGKQFVHVLDESGGIGRSEKQALQAVLDLEMPPEEVEAAVRDALRGKFPARYREMLWLREKGYYPVREGNVVRWIKP